MRRLLIALTLFAAAPASTAWAQEEEEPTALSAAPLAHDRKAVTFQEVEHGFYVSAESGVLFAMPPAGGKLSLGRTAGFDLGFEPVPMFSVGVLIWGGEVSTPSTYFGTCAPSAGACPHGNFSTLTLGGDARLNLPLGADANGVQRLYAYLRAGAGLAIIRPAGLLPSEPMAFGGPGIEYFTHLRHFSIGLEADSTFGLTNHGFAEYVQPTVRYTF